MDGGVLGVRMKDGAGFAELRDGNLDIDALPEQVARIQVGADCLAAPVA